MNVRGLEAISTGSLLSNGMLRAGVSAAALILGGMPMAAVAQTALDPVSVAGGNGQDAPAAQDDSEDGTIVVAGQRAALQNAQNIKRNSEQFVDSVTAVDIGALPDRSVTEAIQRIPGVTVSRFSDARDADRLSVEGSGVQVRGLSFVRGEINGRDGFAARSGRVLGFADVPSELMAGVDVYKNPSADLIEGGIGGTVNLRTRKPFDSKGFVLAGSFDYTYGDLRRDGSPSGSILLSNRWETPIGEIGVLVDFSKSKLVSRTDTVSVDPYSARTDLKPGSTVYVPNGFGYRTLNFDRDREGFDAVVQWRPIPSVEITGHVFQSSAAESVSEHAVGIGNSGNGPAAGTSYTYDSRGFFQSGTYADGPGGTTNSLSVLDERDNTRHSKTTDYSLDMRWEVSDHLTVSADVQYVESKTDFIDFSVFTSTIDPINASKVDLSGKFPVITNSTSAARLRDPAAYFFSAAMDYHNQNDGDEWAWRADAEYSFDGDWLKSFRFGVRGTDKSLTTRETNYNWGFISQPWTGGGVADAATSPLGANTEFFTFPNFFRGAVALPGAGFIVPTSAFVRDFNTAAPKIVAAGIPGCCGPTWRPFNGNYSGSVLGNAGGAINLQDEQTLAAFGLLRFGSEFSGGVSLDGNIGVRVVRTEVTASGLGQFNTATLIPTAANASDRAFANGAATPLTSSNSYTKALPSLNLRLRVTPKLQFRFAAAQSFVRPDFGNLAAVANVSAVTGNLVGGTCTQGAPGGGDCVVRYTAFSGNPNLKPIRSNQYDLAFEYYYSPTGSFTGTLFYKDIYDFVSNDVQNISLTNNGVTKTVLATQPVNVGHGTIKGFEIAYNGYFDFLPGLLNGFGGQANFTYVDSGGARNAAANPFDSTQIGNAQVNLPLEGLSKTSYNVALLYDKGPLSARAAYNWRSSYLMTTSAANLNIPAWAEGYGQLDASVLVNVGGHFKIGVQGSNLLNATTIVSVGQEATRTKHNYVLTDRRFTFVLRGQF